MEGGEKLCGVEQEGGGECHVREELVGGVTRTMAAVRGRGRGAMNTLVVRLSFSPRRRPPVHLGFLARANFDRFLAQLRVLLQKLEF